MAEHIMRDEGDPPLDETDSTDAEEVHLTQFIYLLVLESRLPHKIINLLFTITNKNIKLTDFVGELTF